jgi:hypothetical protein
VLERRAAWGVARKKTCLSVGCRVKIKIKSKIKIKIEIKGSRD